MRYKDLVDRKLEIVDNMLSGLDSLTSGEVTRQEIKDRINQVRAVVSEIQSLIQKEN